MRLVRGLGIVLAASALTVGVAACGSDSDSSSSGSGSTAAATTSAGGEGGDVAAFAQRAEETAATAAARQTQLPPTRGPRPAADKVVFVIPCAMAAEGCAAPARHAVAAARKIGWKPTLIDPQGDPTKQAAAIRQAIAAGADGIVTEAVDAQTIAGPLKEAKDAGIHVVSFASVNQDDLYDQLLPAEDQFEQAGYDLASAMYGQARGDLRIVMMTGTDSQVVNFRVDGTERFVRECEAAGGDCEILAQENYGIPEISTTAPQLAVDTVRQNPDATALWVGYDAAANFMQKALESAGLARGFMASFDANAANLDVIREDGYQKFDVALPPQWIGYAQIDALNRLIAGEETVDEGLRIKLLNKENLPASGTWEGDVDVEPLYLKLWGKGA